MSDTILIAVNSIGICILIVIIIIIIFKYNNRSMLYDNLNYLITTNKIVMSEKDPLRINMVYK